jgi:hypothetical protein
MDKYIYSYTTGRKALTVLIATGVSAGTVWLGHAVKELNFIKQPGYIQAAGFGFIAKGVSVLATPFFSRFIDNRRAIDLLSHATGGVAAYGCSHLGAALGFTAAPITMYAALTLTIISIAMTIFLPPNNKDKVFGTINYPNGRSYTGPLNENGEAHGAKGELRTPTGVLYKGNFTNGLTDILNVTDQNGDQFEGTYLDGMRSYGKLTYKVDGLVYYGPFVNDLPEGDGQLNWPDQTIYYGQFVAGKMNGKGTQKTKNDKGEVTTFKCTWEAGIPISGKVTYPEGQTYEGPFKNNRPEGKCIYRWPNGACYEGDFVTGKGRHGQGKMTEDGDIYEGSWQKDKKEGKFTVTRRNQQPVEEEYAYYAYQNGDEFEGRVVFGTKHHGRFTYKADGRVYTGPFVNGLPQGEGQFVWPNGTIYRGQFVAGNMDGKGIQQVKNDNGSITTFECTWERGNPTSGKVTFPSGHTCEGPFKDNHAEGHCVYKWPNGAHYEGDFVTGKGRDGKGKMTEDNGDVYDGFWQNDKQHGDGTLTQKDGVIYSGKWTEGKKQGAFTVTKPGLLPETIFY